MRLSLVTSVISTDASPSTRIGGTSANVPDAAGFASPGFPTRASTPPSVSIGSVPRSEFGRTRADTTRIARLRSQAQFIDDDLTDASKHGSSSGSTEAVT